MRLKREARGEKLRRISHSRHDISLSMSSLTHTHSILTHETHPHSFKPPPANSETLGTHIRHGRPQTTTDVASARTSRPSQRETTSRSTPPLLYQPSATRSQNESLTVPFLFNRNSTNTASNAASPNRAPRSAAPKPAATRTAWRSTWRRGTRCRGSTWGMCRRMLVALGVMGAGVGSFERGVRPWIWDGVHWIDCIAWSWEEHGPFVSW